MRAADDDHGELVPLGLTFLDRTPDMRYDPDTGWVYVRGHVHDDWYGLRWVYDIARVISWARERQSDESRLPCTVRDKP